MTTAMIIRSFLELAAILLLLYGIAKEEKLIAFEQKIYRIVYVNYRRYIRKKNGIPLVKHQEKANRNFTVYESPKNSPKGQHGFVA